VATQPAAQGNDLSLKTPLIMDIFPATSRVADFVVYDDDGNTYAYENGAYFRQEVAAKRSPRRPKSRFTPLQAHTRRISRVTCYEYTRRAWP